MTTPTTDLELIHNLKAENEGKAMPQGSCWKCVNLMRWHANSDNYFCRLMVDADWRNKGTCRLPLDKDGREGFPDNCPDRAERPVGAETPTE